MPTYSFQLASFLRGRPVEVRADGSAPVVASGTLDANAQFTADLAVGDYVASADDGRYTYRSAGTVEKGDPDGTLTADSADQAFADWVNTPGSATKTALNSTIAEATRVASVPRAVGAVVFTWDDGTPNWLSIAQEAAARGQRHTFCVTSDRVTGQSGAIVDPITPADVQAIHALGHEIASHSKTHTKHPTMTAAQRVTEYDYPRAFLENLIGAPVTTYVYPYGSTGAGRDNTTDREVWGRYDRVLDTNTTGLTPLADRYGSFVIPRRTWSSANHDEVLSLIRQAAVQPVILSVFSHNPGGLVGGQPDVTWAQMLEALDLAQALGVPCLTAAEAFPQGGLLGNPTLNSGTLGAWRTMGTIADTTVVPMVNPPAGYPQSGYVARITTSGTGDTGIRQLVPVEPGKTYTFSAMVRMGADGVGDTITAGGNVYLRFGKSTDYVGTTAGWDSTSTVLITAGAGDKSGAWVKLTATQTIAAGVRFVEPLCVVRGEAGVTAEFAHMWFGESKLGDFA